MTVVDPLGLLPRARELGMRAGAAAGERAGRTAIGMLETALESPRAAELLDVVVTRVTDALLTAGVVDGVLDRAIAEQLPQHIAERMLVAGVAEQVADRFLAGPELDRLVERALDSPRTEELVGQVIDSPLIDASISRVLASEELWRVVERIAESPAVTEAITQHSAGFADEIALNVGERTRRADDRLERVARRMLRRSPRPTDDAHAPGGPA